MAPARDAGVLRGRDRNSRPLTYTLAYLRMRFFNRFVDIATALPVVPAIARRARSVFLIPSFARLGIAEVEFGGASSARIRLKLAGRSPGPHDQPDRPRLSGNIGNRAAPRPRLMHYIIRLTLHGACSPGGTAAIPGRRRDACRAPRGGAGCARSRDRASPVTTATGLRTGSANDAERDSQGEFLPNRGGRDWG
jgi:hypothetical protein